MTESDPSAPPLHAALRRALAASADGAGLAHRRLVAVPGRGMAHDHVAVEGARIGDGPWLNGQAFSFADVACGVMLHRLFTLEHDRPELPNVRAYYERLMARPAYAHVAVSFEALRHPEA